MEIRERRDGDEAVCADIFTRAWNTALPNRSLLVTAEEFLSETDGERVLVAHRQATIVGFLSAKKGDRFIFQRPDSEE